MTTPQKPPEVILDNDQKAAVKEAVTRVVSTLVDAGHLDAEVPLEKMVGEPRHLYKLIAAYREHRDLCTEFVVDAEGNPVMDDETPTRCGVTLAQVEKLLVLTCAKRVFMLKAMKSRYETRTVRKFFFFKKQIQVLRTDKPAEMRKFEQLKPFLGFAWQLPLLKHYRDKVSNQHIMELSEILLLVKDERKLALVLDYDAPMLKTVRDTTGGHFELIISQKPEAIPGIAVWSPEQYAVFMRTMGERAWDFFTRDKEFFNFACSLDRVRLGIYGDMLCDIDQRNLTELERLNLDRLKATVEGFRKAFGKHLGTVIADGSMASGVLRKTVDNFIHMKAEEDQFAGSADVTIQALARDIMAEKGLKDDTAAAE